MAEIAFISDVHSNLEALEAVLAELKGMDVYCLGDLVGYGASPNEVVQALRDRSVVCIQGNHDRAVVDGDVSLFNSRAAMAALWTKSRVSEATLQYLRGLPTEMRLDPGGFPMYLTHGSPDDNLWEYVDPSTHLGVLDYYLARLGVKAIGLGHTHISYTWYGRDGMVFNPGSVGQPRTEDKRASYATLTVEEGVGTVLVHKVEYDWRSASDKIMSAGLPAELAARLVPRRRA